MIIGICGKSGSGKSTLAKQIIELTNNKAIHLDIDKIGHRVLLLNVVKEELVKVFGESIIIDNMVDRKRLGNIVFSNKEEMNKLTSITWKYMQLEIDKFINDNKDRIIILDWLLLPNTKYFKMCDIRVLLDVPYEIRRDRAMKRDNINEDAFVLRDMASISYDKNDFDYVFSLNDNEMVRKLGREL